MTSSTTINRGEIRLVAGLALEEGPRQLLRGGVGSGRQRVNGRTASGLLRARWVGLLLISAVLLATILAGCGGDRVPAEQADPTSVAFPRHDYPLGTDRGGDYFAGQLVLKEGCLLVEVPSNPNNAPWPARLAIWPSSFSLDVESGTVRVFDGQGQVAAQVGDYVRISRAELTPEDYKYAELIAGLPEHCPAGRTFVGAVTVFDPKNEVTKLRLQSRKSCYSGKRP